MLPGFPGNRVRGTSGFPFLMYQNQSSGPKVYASKNLAKWFDVSSTFTLPTSSPSSLLLWDKFKKQYYSFDGENGSLSSSKDGEETKLVRSGMPPIQSVIPFDDGSYLSFGREPTTVAVYKTPDYYTNTPIQIGTVNNTLFPLYGIYFNGFIVGAVPAGTNTGISYSLDAGVTYSNNQLGFSSGTTIPDSITEDGTNFIVAGKDGGNSGSSRIVYFTNPSSSYTVWNSEIPSNRLVSSKGMKHFNGKYFYTGSQGGNYYLYRASSLGGTFSLLSHPFGNSTIQFSELLFLNNNTIVCFELTTSLNRKIAISSDEGNTWFNIVTDLPASNIASLVFQKLLSKKQKV